MKIKNISFPSLLFLFCFFWSIKIPLEINTQRTEQEQPKKRSNNDSKKKMVEREAMEKRSDLSALNRCRAKQLNIVA